VLYLLGRALSIDEIVIRARSIDEIITSIEEEIASGAAALLRARCYSC
jgi:hypothetical protein